jgi:hypothetical protein
MLGIKSKAKESAEERAARAQQAIIALNEAIEIGSMYYTNAQTPARISPRDRLDAAALPA